MILTENDVLKVGDIIHSKIKGDLVVEGLAGTTVTKFQKAYPGCYDYVERPDNLGEQIYILRRALEIAEQKFRTLGCDLTGIPQEFALTAAANIRHTLKQTEEITP